MADKAFELDPIARRALPARRPTPSLAVMTRMLATGILLATLPGCLPYATSYVHLDAPGVSYIQAACGDAGPPVFASYERNGVRFDVTLEPGWASHSKAGFLRLRGPRQVTVSIPDPSGYLTQSGKGGEPALRFELKRMEHPESRHADEILLRRDVIDHRFDFVGLPPITFSGTLQLPTVYLDGVAVTSPTFTFERRPYAGIAPLNC